ncbi:MAG: methyltransferase [Patescibacteria group bacterium]
MKDENSLHFHSNKLHKVLVHSYAVYLFLFIIGVILDTFFDFEIFPNHLMTPVGVFLIIFGTFLIFWAQKTSHSIFGKNINNIEKEITKEIFYRGPYVYTRSPTHWGLFLLILGFGFMTNAFFVVLLTIFSFLLTHFVFLDKHEKILEEKYGDHYKAYKKLVKF